MPVPPSLLIWSSEIPHPPEELLPLTDYTLLSGLGPVLGTTELQALQGLPPGKGGVVLVGFLGAQAYRWVLQSRAGEPSSLLRQYLRPLACSFTELGLSDAELDVLPSQPPMMDRATGRYVSNLLADLAGMGLNGARGAYWSLLERRLVWCRPLERQLTPAFGRILRDRLPANL